MLIFLFSGNLNASANSKTTIAQELEFEQLKQKFIEELKVKYPNGQEIDAQEAHLQKQLNTNAITASAPPLTHLQVYAAISSNYPQYEYFSPNQLTSTYDHGGAELYVVTEELGYGYSQFARMNNALLQKFNELAWDYNGDSIVDG